ncbi:MAG: Chemotaxis protein methyltransferase [Holosporales bacterium]
MDLRLPEIIIPETPKGKIEFEFTDYDFQVISEKIHSLCGIVLKLEKKSMVYARLSRRLRELKIASFREYLEYLNFHEDEEIGNLVNAITTNLTRFFRESHHFDHLARVTIPEVLDYQRGSKDPKIRIWSAASSSGEEPYSIAMTLDHLFKEKRLSTLNAKILATDIDTEMVQTGKNGFYKDIQEVPHPHREYFKKEEKGFKINNDIQRLITFKQLNLLGQWPFQGPFDAVFCRNVVIYFDKKTQCTLFDRIADLLKPKGWLYIGHSESLFKVTDRFELIGQTIYQKVR